MKLLKVNTSTVKSSVPIDRANHWEWLDQRDFTYSIDLQIDSIIGGKWKVGGRTLFEDFGGWYDMALQSIPCAWLVLVSPSFLAAVI